MRLPFYSDCVGWPNPHLEALLYLIDAGEPCTRRTVMRHAAGGMPERWDYHVRYYRLPGWPVYWYVHSAIEYVYAAPEAIERLTEHARPKPLLPPVPR